MLESRSLDPGLFRGSRSQAFFLEGARDEAGINSQNNSQTLEAGSREPGLFKWPEQELVKEFIKTGSQRWPFLEGGGAVSR